MSAKKAEFEQKTITVEAAARELGIGRAFAYELIRQNQFPVRVLRLGRLIKIARADLNAYLEPGKSASGVA